MQKAKVYMRVGNRAEICIGTAVTVKDIPRILESVAAMLRAGIEPEDSEPSSADAPASCR